MSIIRNICAWIRLQLLGSMPAFNHWLPPDDQLEDLLLPPDTCFYCLTHRTEPSWRYACPRRRPPREEIES